MNIDLMDEPIGKTQQQAKSGQVPQNSKIALLHNQTNQSK